MIRTRQLTSDELETIARPLHLEVQALIFKYGDDDSALQWALRHKLIKQLTTDEKGRQIDIRKLKEYKRGEQANLCAICKGVLPEKGAELDRLDGMKPYTKENTRLLCQPCHIEDQASRGFS